MNFEIGARVFTADGEEAGKVDRVVIQPETSEVTHLVVQKGFLFTEDKLIPMDMVGPATEDKVTLRIKSDEIDQFPDFLETEYVLANRDPVTGTVANIARKESIRALYMYPRAGTLGPHTTDTAPYYIRKTENIPDGTVALEEGARVMAVDREHVGNVERILTHPHPELERATHILISEGFFLKEKRLIPTSWIKFVLSDEVHLSVDTLLVESLPEYQP